MSYEIQFSRDAERQIRLLDARDRTALYDEIEQHLSNEPESQTLKRKLLRPNPLARWELRVGDYRVFYEVETDRQAVVILAVGIKEHNRLFIEGEEVSL